VRACAEVCCACRRFVCVCRTLYLLSLDRATHSLFEPYFDELLDITLLQHDPRFAQVVNIIVATTNALTAP
jgi:hypothetical protein